MEAHCSAHATEPTTFSAHTHTCCRTEGPAFRFFIIIVAFTDEMQRGIFVVFVHVIL